MSDKLYEQALKFMRDGGRLTRPSWTIIGTEGWVSDEVAERLLDHPDIAMCDGDAGKPAEWELSKFRR